MERGHYGHGQLPWGETVESCSPSYEVLVLSSYRELEKFVSLLFLTFIGAAYRAGLLFIYILAIYEGFKFLRDLSQMHKL
jgi:hypothetical protein